MFCRFFNVLLSLCIVLITSYTESSNLEIRLAGNSEENNSPSTRFNSSLNKLKSSLRIGSDAVDLEDTDDYYYDSTYYDGTENRVRNITLEDGIQSFGEADDRTDIVVDAAYDDADNFTEGDYEETDYDNWKPTLPQGTTITSTLTTKITSKKTLPVSSTVRKPSAPLTTKPIIFTPTTSALPSTRIVTTTAGVPVTTRQWTALKIEERTASTSLGPKEPTTSTSRVFYVLRLNFTSLLYDEALQDPASHLYRMVAPKIRNALYQDVLNKISGTHTILYLTFGEPIVLATVYITTESPKSTFEPAVRDAVLKLLKTSVIGEFMVDEQGFEFKEISALDLPWFGDCMPAT